MPLPPKPLAYERLAKDRAEALVNRPNKAALRRSGTAAIICGGAETPVQSRGFSMETLAAARDTASHSRGFETRVVRQFADPRSTRAQGRPGAGRTHGPPATKKAGGSHHRFGRTSGLPCAMVLRLIRDLPGDRA